MITAYSTDRLSLDLYKLKITASKPKYGIKLLTKALTLKVGSNIFFCIRIVPWFCHSLVTVPIEQQLLILIVVIA